MRKCAVNDDIFVESVFFQPGEMTFIEALKVIEWEKVLINELDEKLSTVDNEGLISIFDDLYDDPDSWLLFLLGSGGLICILSSIGCVVLNVEPSNSGFLTYPSTDSWINFQAPDRLINFLDNSSKLFNISFQFNSFGLCKFETLDVKNYHMLSIYISKNIGKAMK
jgi:hypothetical protein